ncbi:MAG: phosphoribosylformylglycinamidine cyclo-ligase [Burkholderiales bacterium]|nr:phosphoribosylformylglycinamidine cyclo-ligase [Burkholderiales bacterium]
MQNSITYKDAGVDIHTGDKLVELIKPMAKRTIRKEVLAGIGGFGAMFELGNKYKNPVLVSGTDGVGTKLKLAFLLDRHNTIGIDLVAMSVNDILVQGAEPLFFLDYFACGKLNLEVASSVISGIAQGCEASGCGLIGGETAEMPGMYPDNEYDLAGFAVGAVEKDSIIDGSSISPGDIILGLESSGFHSNGYSLVRKVLGETQLDLNSAYDDTQSWADALLKPTMLYVKPVLELIKQFKINGMSHITGGGLTGNLPRVFPQNLAAHIKLDALPQIKLFTWMAKAANLTQIQMLETFNCGIGYVVVVPPYETAKIEEYLQDQFQIKTYQLGEVVMRQDQEVIYTL